MDHRSKLAGAFSGFVSRLQVEFLLDWLEHTEDESDVGAIAGALIRMARDSMNGRVADTRRSFPASRAGDDDPVTVAREWSFAEYARDHLAHRLEPLIDRETEPKVLPIVLQEWYYTE